MREAEFAGGEVEHGDQVRGGAVAARLAFGGTEDTVETFHKSGALFPARRLV